MASQNSYLTSLIAGGIAGLVVDITLFPLDTLKTRLQSSQGFFKAGGFHNVYKGLGPQAIGSAPTAALFFCTYDTFKAYTTPYVSKETLPLIYMVGASISEVVACLIRVPVEVVKQRRQTNLNNRLTSLDIVSDALRSEGLRGLYRGFLSTIFREIPFSLIQFPLWEYFKSYCSLNFNEGGIVSPWQSALCGSLAGGISAAITTPLDVAKTRIMLADKNYANKHSLNISSQLSLVYKENGIRGLFSGLIPRTLWITLGGAVFFGSYDLAKRMYTVNFAVE